MIDLDELWRAVDAYCVENGLPPEEPISLDDKENARIKELEAENEKLPTN